MVPELREQSCNQVLKQLRMGQGTEREGRRLVDDSLSANHSVISGCVLKLCCEGNEEELLSASLTEEVGLMTF